MDKNFLNEVKKTYKPASMNALSAASTVGFYQKVKFEAQNANRINFERKNKNF